MPSKKPTKSKPAPKQSKSSTASVPAEYGGQVVANIECSECGNKFTTLIGLGTFAEEAGGKFTDPTCGATFTIISVLKSRITVEVLAKGETRTYGKTYDVATKDYARPL